MPTERTPESDVPFIEQLKRLLPSMLGGRPGDVRLPMEAGSQRDPRLGQGSILDSIRQGGEVVSSLGGLKKAAGRK
jgi:hypothetical protein